MTDFFPSMVSRATCVKGSSFPESCITAHTPQFRIPAKVGVSGRMLLFIKLFTMIVFCITLFYA
jgi:hypothetical protein